MMMQGETAGMTAPLGGRQGLASSPFRETCRYREPAGGDLLKVVELQDANDGPV